MREGIFAGIATVVRLVGIVITAVAAWNFVAGGAAICASALLTIPCALALWAFVKTLRAEKKPAWSSIRPLLVLRMINAIFLPIGRMVCMSATAASLLAGMDAVAIALAIGTILCTLLNYGLGEAIAGRIEESDPNLAGPQSWFFTILPYCALLSSGIALAVAIAMFYPTALTIALLAIAVDACPIEQLIRLLQLGPPLSNPPSLSNSPPHPGILRPRPTLLHLQRAFSSKHLTATAGAPTVQD
jgi:hypothetical protein